MALTEWWPLLLGWPAILSAIMVSALGILRERPAYLYGGTILIIPVSLYLSAAPRFPLIALIAPLMLAGAGFATRHGKRRLALGMLVPVLLFFGWLATVVLWQPTAQLAQL